MPAEAKITGAGHFSGFRRNVLDKPVPGGHRESLVAALLAGLKLKPIPLVPRQPRKPKR